MARVYGVTDSEQSFLNLLNSNMQIMNFDNMNDYQDFCKYPQMTKRNEQDYYDDKIQYLTKECINLKEEINKNKKKYDELKNKYYWKSKKVLEFYGDLKVKVQGEIEEIKSEISLTKTIIEILDEKLIKLSKQRDELISEKSITLKKIDQDFKTLSNLNYDKSFIHIRQGAFGEIKLVQYIKEQFKQEKNYNLFNGLKFDISGSGINLNDSTKMDTQIDHVLICPKGIFLIETKFWKKECSQDFKFNLLEQMEKIQRTFQYKFNNKIDSNIVKYLLVGTEKKIDVGSERGVQSLRLDELKDYLNNQQDVLKNEDIILTLHTFIKHIPKSKFKDFPRYRIAMVSYYLRLKNKVIGNKNKDGKTLL